MSILKYVLLLLLVILGCNTNSSIKSTILADAKKNKIYFPYTNYKGHYQDRFEVSYPNISVFNAQGQKYDAGNCLSFLDTIANRLHENRFNDTILTDYRFKFLEFPIYELQSNEEYHFSEDSSYKFYFIYFWSSEMANLNDIPDSQYFASIDRVYNLFSTDTNVKFLLLSYDY